MKKVLKRISLIGTSLMCLLQSFCYADEINPIATSMLANSRKMMKEAEPAKESSKTWPIIIGIAVAVIVIVAIIVLVKNKKKKDGQNEEQK